MEWTGVSSVGLGWSAFLLMVAIIDEDTSGEEGRLLMVWFK